MFKLYAQKSDQKLKLIKNTLAISGCGQANYRHHQQRIVGWVTIKVVNINQTFFHIFCVYSQRVSSLTAWIPMDCTIIVLKSISLRRHTHKRPLCTDRSPLYRCVSIQINSDKPGNWASKHICGLNGKSSDGKYSDCSKSPKLFKKKLYSFKFIPIIDFHSVGFNLCCA